MSLQSQLNSFVLRVSELFDRVDARTGPLDSLATSAKHDLVAAINELAARDSGSSSGVAYLHTQNVPATSWTINHNLGLRPAVSIIDTGGNEVEAEVSHTSANQLVIRFAIPLAGLARLI
ncbi:MAG: hypothetical protein CTY19_05945 [Methylomonas sp.]|nr:MAG: hypothetical protein CTY19_05945 [Methylomonas sp.]